jgi:hypothetical protein
VGRELASSGRPESCALRALKINPFHRCSDAHDANQLRDERFELSMLRLCSFFLALTTTAFAAAPPAVWDAPDKLTDAELAVALKKANDAAAPLPSVLLPAVKFQQLLLRIRAGARVDEWRDEVKKFASEPEKSTVGAGLKELALAWEARARMADVDKSLRGYYRTNVRFPGKLAEAGVTGTAANDAWGDAWTYAPTKPKGFSDKFTSQRYTLTPGKHPQVRAVEDTLNAPSPAKNWKPTARDVSGQRVLEFRTASGTVATQAGGRVEDAVVLYVGDGWAVLADLERIFTVTF